MSKRLDTIDISLIKDPKFLLGLSFDELESVCSSIRTELLDKVSKHGGHLSSNLGIVELTVALHRVFDFSKDKIIFDVGHQSYVHKILTGRHLDHLLEKDGISGFQKRSESIYDCYEAGHSSTSISAAEGFAIARDQKKENFDVVAVIGDASIVNGLSFEALNDIGGGNHKVIIILNDNEMAITQPKGSLSNHFRKIASSSLYNRTKTKYRDFLMNSAAGQKLYAVSTKFKSFVRKILVHDETIFEKFGLTYIGPVDGHNLKALEKALKRSKNTTKSTIVHVRTIKGKGYKYSENDNIGYWHGVTPFNIETGKPNNLHEGLISWSHYFSDLTKELMGANQNTYLIVPATLKGSGLESTFAAYPERCSDVGIAEEHALTLAGSLAINGLHPIVTVYSTFLQRAYDELSHDCSRMNANMTILIDRAGLVGTNGETHQGIYDVAYLNSIPNVTITMPTNKDEAKQLYLDSLEDKGIFAIRYPRDFVVDAQDTKKITIPHGSFKFERETNKKLLVIGVGPLSRTLLNKVVEDNIDCSYANALYLNPIAKDTLEKVLKYENILIYDAYGTKEGFTYNLESKLIELGYKGNIFSKTVPNEFIKQATIKEQLSDLSLDTESLANEIKTLLK